MRWFFVLGSPEWDDLLTCLRLGGRAALANGIAKEAVLAASSNARLRVGVVGLGRLWETRHKPSLARMADRFQVTAVYDQVFRRAEIEAAHSRCAACEGLRALVDRSDVDVIYLLSRQWFGLHPAALACAAGKPVYCALPLAGERVELESLVGLVESRGVLFMTEFPRRYYPATIRLRELLAGELGPPRLIVGHSRLHGFDRYAVPGPTTQIAPSPLLIDPGGYLLDWCRHVFDAPLERLAGMSSRVLKTAEPGAEETDFETFSARFVGGGAANLSYGRHHRSVWGEAGRLLPPQGFQVYAERGAAWLEMPEKIVWSTGTAVHEERLPVEPSVGDVLNDRFYRLVHEGGSPSPSLRETLDLARWIEVLRQSRIDAASPP